MTRFGRHRADNSLAASLGGLSEAALMQRIRGAERLGQLEALLLRHHDEFRHQHVAAAMAVLPELGVSTLNRGQRVRRAMHVLSGGLLRCINRLDSHQMAGCVAAMGRLRMAPAPALQALLHGLLAGRPGAERARDLNPGEVAALARSLAALEEVGADTGGVAAGVAPAGAAGAAPQLVAPAAGPAGGGVGGRMGSSADLAAAALASPLDAGRSLEAAAAGSCDGASALVGAAASVEPHAGASRSSSGSGGGSLQNQLQRLGGTEGGSALALTSPAERLWLLLAAGVRHRADDFTAPDLCHATWAFARRGRTTPQLLAAVSRSLLLRPHKLDAAATTRALAALAAAGARREVALLRALTSCVVGLKAEFTPQQALVVVQALQALGVQDTSPLLALCKVAANRIPKYDAPRAALHLLCALTQQRFRDDPLLRAFCRTLPAWASAAAASSSEPPLSDPELVAALAAPLLLGYTEAPEVLEAAGQVFRLLAPRAHQLPAAAAATLLWCAAMLRETDPMLLRPLLLVLHAATPAPPPAAPAPLRPRRGPGAWPSGGDRPVQPSSAVGLGAGGWWVRLADPEAGGLLDEEQLCLLYQAHRLLTDEWLLPAADAGGGGGGNPLDEREGNTDISCNGEQHHLGVAEEWAAMAGGSGDAVVFGSDGHPTSRRRSGRADAVHVGLGSDDEEADAIRQLLAPPKGAVRSLTPEVRVRFHDSGGGSVGAAQLAALWPQSLLLAGRRAAARRAAASRGARSMVVHVTDILEDAGHEPVQNLGLDAGALVADVALVAGALKVAVLCDGPSRCTRSGPHLPTGYWLGAGRVLQRAGWRVVRLPWAEWQALGDAESQMMHLYNVFGDVHGILL